MRYLVITFFLFTGSIFAKAEMIKNESQELQKMIISSKCDIVKRDVYKYCIDHGFTKEEAKSIADSALKECKKISNTISEPEMQLIGGL